MSERTQVQPSGRRLRDAWRALRGQPPVLTLAVMSRINVEVEARFGKPHGGVVDVVENTLIRAGFFVREPGYFALVEPAILPDVPYEVLHPNAVHLREDHERWLAEQAACSHEDGPDEDGCCWDCGADLTPASGHKQERRDA